MSALAIPREDLSGCIGFPRCYARGMNREQAVEAMMRILGEERRRPNTRYKLADAHPLLQILVPAQLNENRKDRPRSVKEDPREFEVAGKNYELLMLLFSGVDLETKQDLVEVVLQTVTNGGACSRITTNYFPSYCNQVSDLPLIAEFCVRTGNHERLFRAISEAPVPTPAIVLMMLQVEEMLALNFDIFEPEMLKKIPAWLEPLRKTAFNHSHKVIRPRGVTGEMKPNPQYRPGREKEASHILAILQGISEECAHALFYYTKGAVERRGPLEAERDKRKIIDYLEGLGFPENLRGALEEAEKLFREDASTFQLKSCMGHLRSFLEALHAQSAKAIARSYGEEIDYRWGKATEYLKTKGVISEQHKNFATSLFTLISDTSVHSLTADYDYARLIRTVVIEYGVMFLAAVSARVGQIAPGIQTSSQLRNRF
jgi:hypothetical protein